MNAERIGARFYSQNGEIGGLALESFSGRTLRRLLTQDLDRAVLERQSRAVTYSIDDEALEFFIEVIEPTVSTIIFGAGHDAVPIAAFAKQLGWNITIVDRRPAYAARARFPDADAVIAAHVEDLDDEIFSDENAVAVVMTHHFDSDREIVRRLVGSPVRYVGILGPKQRTADLLKQISDSGTVVDRSFLERIHAPVGLDIGATNPESIALSIVAEIQAVLGRRDGGHLKNRTKPIYDR
jgi:xanthine/CO dehydrogenase XdhC/CoxF family maturation factor